MTSISRISMIAFAALVLPGCVAKTAYNVVTMPVKATSKAVDWATVSGDEADRERGRELRKKCKENYDPQYCKD